MIKHAIVYDDNKSILVVIMPVYAIGAAILVAMRLRRRSSKAFYPYNEKATGPTVGKVGMGSILVPSIFRYWGS